MATRKLLTEIQCIIVSLYESFEDQTLFFHTVNHVLQVVTHVQELCAYYQISEADTFVVSTAAWFHDLGYLTVGAAGHEYKSAELAGKYLSERLPDADMLMQIQQCILATILPQRPQTLLEQIICDADLYHLGTEDFFYRDGLMRKETELRVGKIDDKKWLTGSIDLLESHKFHTKYCQQNLGKKKQWNLDTSKAMLQKIE
ncbi:HD domain-containing protein [Dyadobacter psychrophilus]|uniref:HD domain-containing protein n=2 Tax=Dyadobacter psychrophilus TaxID=651661 RepID=A0A1T5HGM7_9BACT|nr:HD domain-containing protein [Dyadobacter psychrophilus]